MAYDLATGNLLQTLATGGGNFTGLAGEGLFLYTMDANRVLHAIDLSDGDMVPRGALTMPAGGGKLFVGERDCLHFRGRRFRHGECHCSR